MCRSPHRLFPFPTYPQVWFSLVVSVWSVPHTHSTTTTAFACIFQCFFCQQVQQSCNSSSASPDTSEEPCPTDMVKMTKSKTFQAYLPSCHRTYSCIHCRAHLANHDELISKVRRLHMSSLVPALHIKPPCSTSHDFSCSVLFMGEEKLQGFALVSQISQQLHLVSSRRSAREKYYISVACLKHPDQQRVLALSLAL